MNSAKIVDGTVANLDLGRGLGNRDKIADATVANLDLGADSVTGDKIADATVANADLGVGLGEQHRRRHDHGVDVWDESLAAVDLAIGSVGTSRSPDSVRSAKVAATRSPSGSRSVNSSELGAGSVGANEMRYPHLHFSAATNVTDATAHDGVIRIQLGDGVLRFRRGTAQCCRRLDRRQRARREELFRCRNDNCGTDPQTAVVEANFDGGGGAGNPAQFVAVAICIF